MKLLLHLITAASIFATPAIADNAPLPKSAPRATLEASTSLSPGTTFPELVRKVGESHVDIGSSVFIYCHHLSDDSKIYVSTSARKAILEISHDSGAVCTRLFPISK